MIILSHFTSFDFRYAIFFPMSAVSTVSREMISFPDFLFIRRASMTARVPRLDHPIHIITRVSAFIRVSDTFGIDKSYGRESDA